MSAEPSWVVAGVPVVPKVEHDNLKEKLAAEKQRRLYWQGVTRGARAELSVMERITPEEYAALCSDTECRDYVDQMDKLKEQRDELLKALEEVDRFARSEAALCSDEEAVLRQVRAAIAKAKGGR